MASITFKGSPVSTVGELPALQSDAPAFSLVNGELADISLSDYAGKTVVLNIVPSLDTSVCQASARRFNEEASSLENTVVVNVSCDLPFAMGRFCSSEGLENVDNLSVFRSPEFGGDYGVSIADGPLRGLLSRAVLVLNGDGKVVYSEQVPEIAQEPNYDAALAAIS